MKTLVLQASDIGAIVRKVGVGPLMREMIFRLREGIIAWDPAASSIPPRAGISYPGPCPGLLEWMPVYRERQGTVIKIVGFHPDNPESRELPTIVSTIFMFDSDSGHLKGVIDGTFATALRTGAASAVASGALACPESATLGIVGCGAQAVTQAHALCESFPIERILAYDVDGSVSLTLRQRLAFLGIPVIAVDRAGLPEMLEECDILCTCTSEAPGRGPVIPDFVHRPHVHINAVGSDLPGKYEIPATLLRRTTVCPDFPEQAIKEGECQQLESGEIGPDLREVLRGGARIDALRERPTVFDSTGWALEDHIAGRLLMEKAEGLGLGSEMEIECLPEDPRNPYAFRHMQASSLPMSAAGLRA